MNVSRLVSLQHPYDSLIPPSKIQMAFQIESKNVLPTSLLHTCIVYKNGDAILNTSVPSWTENQVDMTFHVDALHSMVSDISMVLVSPSDGEWSVPKVVFTDDMGDCLDFVATNLDGNCTFAVPEPPNPEKIQEGMDDYADLKQRLLRWQVALVGSSSILIHFANPTDVYTKFFAVGGFVGLMYQVLMQMEVDQVGSATKSILYRAIANTFFRLSLLTSAFVIITSETGMLDTSAFATILAGFMMNKVAMYVTFWNQKNEKTLLKD